MSDYNEVKDNLTGILMSAIDGACPADVDDISDALTLIEQQQARIAELEQRNNELSATVERLLKACELARDNYGKMLMTDPPQEAWKARQVTERLVEAIAATPQQNLNAVKREVAATAIRVALRNLGNADLNESEINHFADDYINQLYPDKELLCLSTKCA